MKIKLWLTGVIAVVAVMVGIWAVSSKSRPPQANTSTTQQPSDTQLNPALVQDTNQFAFNLLKELLNPQVQQRQKRPAVVQTASPNMVFSPLGVQFVLTLFLNGAEGQTYQEIAQALGFQNASLREINQFHRQLRHKLQRWQVDAKLIAVNSIWIRPVYRLHPDFERIGSQFYALEANKADFGNRVEAARQINAWMNQRTQGQIPKLLVPEEIDPAQTILVLANALYLRALWQQPFKVADYEREFHPEKGKPFRFRPMEAELEGVPYGHNDLCRIVGLPYQNGDWVCYVVLPREGLRVQELVEQMDALRWQEWLGQLARASKVQVVLPRFEVASEYDLIPALERLGVRRAFDPEQAEFPKILKMSDVSLDRLTTRAGYVSVFKQVVQVRVDERGTEAGAGTVAVTESLEVITVDRPFVFVIAERESGVILFMGVVHQPEG